MVAERDVAHATDFRDVRLALDILGRAVVLGRAERIDEQRDVRGGQHRLLLEWTDLAVHTDQRPGLGDDVHDGSPAIGREPEDAYQTLGVDRWHRRLWRRLDARAAHRHDGRE